MLQTNLQRYCISKSLISLKCLSAYHYKQIINTLFLLKTAANWRHRKYVCHILTIIHNNINGLVCLKSTVDIERRNFMPRILWWTFKEAVITRTDQSQVNITTELYLYLPRHHSDRLATAAFHSFLGDCSTNTVQTLRLYI